MAELAQLVARDGEGAQKLVTIDVTGAKSDASARIIARAIANSPLVKTAIAGADANWGRIVMAVGKSAEPRSEEHTSELQSLMRHSYAVFCLKKNNKIQKQKMK